MPELERFLIYFQVAQRSQGNHQSTPRGRNSGSVIVKVTNAKRGISYRVHTRRMTSPWAEVLVLLIEEAEVLRAAGLLGGDTGWRTKFNICSPPVYNAKHDKAITSINLS